MSEQRIASLDFLRGSAALSVAIPHFFMFQHIGDRVAETISILGVEMFFVLSGYVLAPQILFFVIEKPNIRNLGVFLVRRWMRTIPPYLVALLLISATAHELLTPDFFRYSVYVQNFYQQSNTSDYFSIAWSLSVEEWFYLLFPPFFIVVAWITPRKQAVIAALLFILLLSLCRSLLGDYAHWGSEVRRVVIFRVDAIAWGFLLNLAVTNTRIVKRVTGVQTLAVFLIMAAVSIGLTWLLAEHPSEIIEQVFPLYSAALGASAILLAIKARPVFERYQTLSSMSLFLGRISYSTYLFHLLVLFALADHLSSLSWPLLLVVYLASTGGVASLMYLAVEAPILAARPHYQDRTRKAVQSVHATG